MAAVVQFSWPRAFSYLAARVQIPMSAVTAQPRTSNLPNRGHETCPLTEPGPGCAADTCVSFGQWMTLARTAEMMYR
jgi:hypothetical protein